MTTYTITFEETSFLPVRQYEVKTIDDFMRLMQKQTMLAEYDLTVTLSKIERDDEMPIKGELVDEVQFSINKNNSASQAEIGRWKCEVAYRDKKIEQLEQEIRELKGELYSVRKEFAEKIKAKSYVNNYCREVVEIDKIDELLKEYE